MKLTDILGAAGIVTLIVLAFILGKTCNEPKPDDSVKRAIDSLIAEHQKTASEWKTFRDSMETQIRRKDSTIASLVIEKEAARINARKSAENASRWARRYDSAKTALDTSAILIACDSIRTEFDVFRDATDVFVRSSDSVISLQNQKLLIKDSIIARQDRRIASDSVTIKKVGGAYYDELSRREKAEKKVKRRDFWQWPKIAAGVAAGIFVGNRAR